MHREVTVYYGAAIQDLLDGLNLTKYYSVDKKYCANIAGLTRLPGTLNTHANTYCTYELIHRCRILLTEQHDTVEYRSSKGAVSSKHCCHFASSAVQAAGLRRVNALLKLLKLRSKWEGYRDSFLFALFSAHQMTGYSDEDALRLTLEANSEFGYPLPEHEVRSLLSTATKKHYKMENTYIINTLGITADEQIAIGISIMPSGAAKRGKNQARDERTAAKRRAENRKIMRMHILGNSIVAIAKKMGRCYNTVKKRISELAGKLEELFSGRELKLLFRQRAKRIVEELKKCITPISFFEGLIYYANMQQASMSQSLVKPIEYQLEYSRNHRRNRDCKDISAHLVERPRCAR